MYLCLCYCFLVLCMTSQFGIANFLAIVERAKIHSNEFKDFFH